MCGKKPGVSFWVCLKLSLWPWASDFNTPQHPGVRWDIDTRCLPITLLCQDNGLYWSRAVDERKYNVLYDKSHYTWGRESAGILEKMNLSCCLSLKREVDGHQLFPLYLLKFSLSPRSWWLLSHTLETLAKMNPLSFGTDVGRRQPSFDICHSFNTMTHSCKDNQDSCPETEERQLLFLTWFPFL